ncbi:hypothetical protein [Paraburkholderia unamae]|uniref:Uncharacterized protein n=1 Tax=Paraburkholderia unamae TaxID=219649 RepID=A0ABX5KSI7_9BURK|nr:hypothetical protein [Paraburkholderia unamae]PVX85731.1 hypothetical protein C7402_103309 [Paraburkholderia unamae]
MFGLYPSGPAWVRHFTATVPAREIQQLLVKHAGFVAGLFHQPFGAQRGAVIAQRNGFVVMTDDLEASHAELVVAPDVELTNLLWSQSSGYANQWSARELHALTGCDGWESLLKAAGNWFSRAGDDLALAVAGTLGAKPVAPAAPAIDPVLSVSFPDDDDAPWLPSDYLHETPFAEGMSCGH